MPWSSGVIETTRRAEPNAASRPTERTHGLRSHIRTWFWTGQSWAMFHAFRRTARVSGDRPSPSTVTFW